MAATQSLIHASTSATDNCVRARFNKRVKGMSGMGWGAARATTAQLPLYLHVRGNAIDELGRNLIGRHRATQEADAHAADAENEARLARAEHDAE